MIIIIGICIWNSQRTFYIYTLLEILSLAKISCYTTSNESPLFIEEKPGKLTASPICSPVEYVYVKIFIRLNCRYFYVQEFVLCW